MASGATTRPEERHLGRDRRAPFPGGCDPRAMLLESSPFERPPGPECMMKKSPLSQVQERFETKEKLVEALKALAQDDLWIDRVNPEKGLKRVSNAKLVRLHDLLTDAKKRFGSRDKLIESILTLTKSVRDAGYRERLKAHPLPRLLDLHGALSRKQSRAEAKSSGDSKKKAPLRTVAAKKAAAKAAVKKTPSKRPSGRPKKAKK